MPVSDCDARVAPSRWHRGQGIGTARGMIARPPGSVVERRAASRIRLSSSTRTRFARGPSISTMSSQRRSSMTRRRRIVVTILAPTGVFGYTQHHDAFEFGLFDLGKNAIANIFPKQQQQRCVGDRRHAKASHRQDADADCADSPRRAVDGGVRHDRFQARY